jgi:hypothetical protein
MHRLAVDRYEALRNYIERDSSPLAGRVRIFYPQGSMAIRATIRSRKREDGFDIDIVAELILPTGVGSATVLDLRPSTARRARSITAKSSATHVVSPSTTKTGCTSTSRPRYSLLYSGCTTVATLQRYRSIERGGCGYRSAAANPT